MERKDFLRTLGAGAAFALTFPCVNGCSKNDGIETFPVSDGVDFTIDLTSTEAAPLANNGGFISIKSNPDFTYLDIVVARNLSGELIAASKICSHQGTEEIRFITEDGGVYHCTTHQSRFAQDGTSLNLKTTSNPLKIFNTELNGSMLRIFE
ncbi:nitrite reductase/ring-hydroxylating ferredoxin subunit [Saonia flava]|uniref:Nitrite reductase/ring-hydroxylating ferredoxin subunit n=1 Tax=Saonia flava TaxID=523696 RepID=A0A846R0Q3_9FLAO|nr:Rieske 2Fe-2S domain-containing protein [Saonia flava]NJB72532.1 nitrite reductase/ring-hydroxylating ferredoxin subunit [Saonia flava]